MWILFFFFMKEIYVLCLKTWFNFVIDPLISDYKNSKYSERRNNVDKHTLAQLSFSTKYQRWNNVGSSTLNRRNFIDVVSTLFFQRWNNVERTCRLSFCFQQNISVETTLMNVDDFFIRNSQMTSASHSLKTVCWIVGISDRSSLPEVFSGKGALKICRKFTGEHLCRSMISIKLLCNFIEIALRQGCSPVNLLYIFRTPFPENIYWGLILSKDVARILANI